MLHALMVCLCSPSKCTCFVSLWLIFLKQHGCMLYRASPCSVVVLMQNNVNPTMALKTPQFYALSTTFFCVACGGIGLFSVAKPMMGEVFSSTLPTLVTAGFASLYVQVRLNNSEQRQQQ